MEGRLFELQVENFRSLRKVSIPLRPLNVLVGPNGAGKTNILDVFRFLADVIRTDLEPALSLRGGYDELVFRGGEKAPATIKLGVKASWTAHSHSGAPDEYELRIENRAGRNPTRKEAFTFKRTQGRGRRITISGETASFFDVESDSTQIATGNLGLRRFSSGLSTLPRLSDDQGGEGPGRAAEQLASFRVFEINVASAKLPSRFPRGREILDDDAANLASFLLSLHSGSSHFWQQLRDDAREVLPQLEDIEFDFPSGPTREVVVQLRERGLRNPTPLSDASYGTIRLLGLLALLYDPNPPSMTCVEEIDHGLHPQALELLVQRLRDASERTQFVIATHSPALADRLKPDELIVCERRADGSSAVPALPESRIASIVARSEDMPLGELWFSGALGGDL